MKTYSLNHFGGNRFALANETDKDIMTDYFPGIWGISSQKEAVSHCKEILEEGNEITAGIGDASKISKVLERT